MKQPDLSIVVPVYNAQHHLDRFFRSIENQKLSGKEIEILVVDGGSTDTSREIAQLHHAKIIHNPDTLAEPGVALGVRHARADLVMVLATDNIFKEKDALATIISVFTHSDIIAAFPKHDTDPKDSLYSRYFNTFTDPYTHVIYGNAANARTFHHVYTTLKHTPLYDIYDYSSSGMLPLIALAQGFTVRKSYLKNRTDKSDDVLVIYDILKTKSQIAYLYSVSLYHYTVDNARQFIKKQRRAVQNALLRGNSGIAVRTRYLTNWQKIKRYLFFPYSLSIVFPIIVGVIQFIRTGEKMWIVHPFMVFISACVILWETIRLFVRRCFI